MYAVFALAYIMAWPDHNIVNMFLEGAKPLGEQQRYGIYRNKETAAKMSEQDLADQHRAARDSGDFGYPHKGEQAEAMLGVTR